MENLTQADVDSMAASGVELFLCKHEATQLLFVPMGYVVMDAPTADGGNKAERLRNPFIGGTRQLPGNEQ